MNRGRPGIDYSRGMARLSVHMTIDASAATPSRRTLHAEMLRLCARIGYSPPVPPLNPPRRLPD